VVFSGGEAAVAAVASAADFEHLKHVEIANLTRTLKYCILMLKSNGGVNHISGVHPESLEVLLACVMCAHAGTSLCTMACCHNCMDLVSPQVLQYCASQSFVAT
jgi:hypothetical protein